MPKIIFQWKNGIFRTDAAADFFAAGRIFSQLEAHQMPDYAVNALILAAEQGLR